MFHTLSEDMEQGVERGIERYGVSLNPYDHNPLSQVWHVAMYLLSCAFHIGQGGVYLWDCRAALVRRHQTCDFRDMPLLLLQSSEGKFTMSREIEPVRRSFRKH